MKRQSIYLVGPISGLNYDEVIARYRQYKDALSEMYDLYWPLAAKDYLRTELEFKAHGYEGFPPSTNHSIVCRDRWMVRQADIVIADFQDAPERVSIGSCMELAWASDQHSFVIGILPEKNIHNHAFILETIGTHFKRREDAIQHLIEFQKGIGVE